MMIIAASQAGGDEAARWRLLGAWVPCRRRSSHAACPDLGAV